MYGQGHSTYTKGAITFHWLIALLIIGNLIGGFTHESVSKEMMPVVMGLHKASGITILFLSLARLGWRLTHRPPPLAATVKVWEKGLAHATHWTFYILMLAIPLTGWLMVSAGARKWPLSWFGVFDIPFLPVAQDKAAADTYAERHEFLAFLIIAMLVLHIAAAIKHHFFDRDDTVARMLPAMSPRA
jgi:cytochrome b561